MIYGIISLYIPEISLKFVCCPSIFCLLFFPRFEPIIVNFWPISSLEYLRYIVKIAEI